MLTAKMNRAINLIHNQFFFSLQYRLVGKYYKRA
jgi:hypothetical protein